MQFTLFVKGKGVVEECPCGVHYSNPSVFKTIFEISLQDSSKLSDNSGYTVNLVILVELAELAEAVDHLLANLTVYTFLQFQSLTCFLIKSKSNHSILTEMDNIEASNMVKAVKICLNVIFLMIIDNFWLQ